MIGKDFLFVWRSEKNNLLIKAFQAYLVSDFTTNEKSFIDTNKNI